MPLPFKIPLLTILTSSQISCNNLGGDRVNLQHKKVDKIGKKWHVLEIICLMFGLTQLAANIQKLK